MQRYGISRPSGWVDANRYTYRILRFPPRGSVVPYEVTPASKDDGKSDRGSPPLGRIATAWRSLPGFLGGIGWHLLVRVLLFSSVITLLLTLTQLYLDYRRDVGAIDLRMSEIDGSYRQSLSERLWRLDSRQLQLLVDGISRMPDIRYVELREATDRAAPLVVTAGSHQENPPERREFRIFYTNHGVEQLVGILVVEATFDGVYRRLLDTAAVIVVSQGIKTFVVSFFILLIVHRLITRHLNAMAASLRGYDLRGSEVPLQLDRRPTRPADELDRLVGAFNRMYARLREREKQRAATSEMLRIIASSPIESVLDAVAENAARLSDANNAEIFRLEDNRLRLAASYGEIPVVIHAYQGVAVDRDTVTGRAACDRRTIHVHDLAVEEGEYPVGSSNAKREGHRTTLATALLREGNPIGVILVRRKEVRPFSDEQIALIETFADQAVIAIENARLFEAEKQHTLALAGANRNLAESEARIRRLVDSGIIGIYIWDFEGRVLEANGEFLRMVNYDREDLVAGRIRWTDLTPPDWRDRTSAKMERQKSSGRFEPFEKEYIRKDGSRFPLLVGGATFEQGGDKGIAFVVDLTDQKRAEEKSRESELKLRQITETVPGLVWSNGPDGELTHINQRMLDYSGMRFEEFMQRGWEAFVHPADYPETAEAFRYAIETGTSYQRVMRLRRADGEFRWHHARCEPLCDRQGRIIQWYGLCVDVEEAKTTEDRLRRSEAHLAEAERLSHTGAVAYNGTAILFASEETYRIWGFDPAQGLPSRDVVFQRIHPGDRDRLKAEVRREVGKKRRYSVGYRIVLPDGTVKHLETIGQPVFSASGKLVEIFATQTDVTERKRAEEALRESEAKFRDYAETASDWFWEIDPDHKFTLLTENAFGSDAADRIGKPCWDHALDVETEPEKWRLVWATLDAHESFRDFVYCTVDGSGAPMYVKASGKPVFDSSGKFLGYRGTGTDVTAIVRGQRAEASLQAVQAELAHVSRVMTLGQLTASIAHEVNQPIGSARNNARAALNFLDRRPPDLGEVREALGCIVADADRAGGIIDRIRDQIKKVPPRSDRFDLNRAIEEVVELAQSMITENGVSVQSRLASGMALVHGDRVQLQQVVLNLILNAVEAMRSVEADERQLLISTDQSEANVTLVAVRDSGPGVDPKHLEHVFEAFYSTKSGMGMGLSICRSIIAAHGGRLWAAAAEPEGALFQFTLPNTKSSIARPFATLESRNKTSL
jgi:PAS domain S-box-containing protein